MLKLFGLRTLMFFLLVHLALSHDSHVLLHDTGQCVHKIAKYMKAKQVSLSLTRRLQRKRDSIGTDSGRAVDRDSIRLNLATCQLAYIN